MKNRNDYQDGIKMLKKYLYENHFGADIVIKS